MVTNRKAWLTNHRALATNAWLTNLKVLAYKAWLTKKPCYDQASIAETRRSKNRIKNNLCTFSHFLSSYHYVFKQFKLYFHKKRTKQQNPENTDIM